jgi:cytochrome c1
VESQVLCKQIRSDVFRHSKSLGLSVNSQGLVVKGSQVVVPDHCDGLKWDIMEAFHDAPTAGHYGIAETCKAVQKLFFWTSMREDVARYVSNCPSCARNKARRHAPYGRLQTIPVPEKPWHSVSMDLINCQATSNGQGQ